MQSRRLLALLLLLAACSPEAAGDRSLDSGASETPSQDAGETSNDPDDPDEPAASTGPGPLVRVRRVIDGDTVEVALGGDAVSVRLIGVDTPETVHPSEPVECYGRAASRFTTRELDGLRVHLEFDVERRDRFGRTLAYIWRGDELFNLTLVEQGYAQVNTFPPNVQYEGLFVEAQRDARRRDRGLWGPVCDQPIVVDEGDNDGDGGGGGGNCDPSYPGVCIPPYPPDLDCGEVAHTNFAVTGSDPHGFDGDNDGVGCET